MVISLSQMLDFVSPCFFSFQKTKSLELKRLRWIILDEADRYRPILCPRIHSCSRFFSSPMSDFGVNPHRKRCFREKMFFIEQIQTSLKAFRENKFISRKHKLSVLQEASYHCNNWRALAQDCYLSGLIDISICCRLLDLGFEKDVSSILTAVKDSLLSGVRCQTVLLSATLNEGVFFSQKCLLLL